MGTTSITLSQTTNLAVGSTLILDQLDDSADGGGIFVCQATGVCATEGPGSGSFRTGAGTDRQGDGDQRHDRDDHARDLPAELEKRSESRRVVVVGCSDHHERDRGS